MPRKRGKVPSYCLHKASGRAVVRIGDRDHYLGAYGSQESHEEYERLIAEWRVHQAEAARGHEAAEKGSSPTQLSVNAMLLRYMKFAATYYVDTAGEPMHELDDMKYALRPVRKLYGRTPVRDFGPLALKAVRQYMINAEDLSRKVINARINRIKRVFKWAVSEELAPAGSYEALRTVAGLRYGRTTARETEPIKPVPKPWVAAVVEAVTPTIAAMIQVQELAAMRPCEVVAMRACDIDIVLVQRDVEF